MTTGSNNMYPNLTGEEILKFKETFINFDPNGSGDENTATINTKDLGIIVRSLGFCPTEAEVKEMITEAESEVPLLDRVVDNNGTRDNSFNLGGRLMLPTFLKLMSDYKREPENEDDICDAFKEFDEDGNGTISLKELKKMLTGMGEKLSDEEFDFMLKEANVSGTGNVKYEDFVKNVFAK